MASVLWYVPNLVGYLRAIIYLAAGTLAMLGEWGGDGESSSALSSVEGGNECGHGGKPELEAGVEATTTNVDQLFFFHVDAVLALLLCGHVLDAVDGKLARIFNQCSKFGEVLDVLLDNWSRSLTWVLAVSSHIEQCGGKMKNCA